MCVCVSPLVYNQEHVLLTVCYLSSPNREVHADDEHSEADRLRRHPLCVAALRLLLIRRVHFLRTQRHGTVLPVPVLPLDDTLVKQRVVCIQVISRWISGRCTTQAGVFRSRQ